MQYTDYSIYAGFSGFIWEQNKHLVERKKAIPRFNDTILKQPALTGHGRIPGTD